MNQSVLVVGPAGNGGIDRYITEQRSRMGERVDLEVFTGYEEPADGGARGALESLATTALAALRYPFQSRPDIVHVHTSHRFSFYRSSWYVLVAKYVWDADVVLHVHGSGFDEFLETDSSVVGSVQSVVFDAVDDVIVLSAYWADIVSRFVDDDSVHVVHNAVDADRYDPAYDVDPISIVFVSNLIERKGVTELVSAVERLQERVQCPFEVHVAGDGSYRERVEALERRYDNVTYHGFVSERRKRELLAEGSVFVLPTRAENLPIALLEGMAGGNAVVSTTVGAIPEVVGEDNGLLVEPGDTEALTDALEELLANPDRLVEMARTNREAIRDRYTWQECADSIRSVYRRAGE